MGYIKRTGHMAIDVYSSLQEIHAISKHHEF